MINVTLKGGAVKEFEPGVSPADVAKSIGMGLYKSACAARVDGEAVDLRTPLEKDCELEILTFDSPEGKHAFWHTGAHIMAQAIQHLFPDAQFGIGPALDDGWYYDIGGMTTVSESYAEEIKMPFYGEHLDGLMRARSNCLTGIVNGLDYNEYNPETDPLIYKNYTAKTFRKEKIKNKRGLQKELGLAEDDKKFMIGICSRLTDQKGLDLVDCVIEQICDENTQLVVLGTGEERYENLFRHFEWKYHDRVSANIFYSNDRSHKLYAACDAFLMPSLFEPCGLSQLMSLRYGTVPIVRETGGLRDTVEPYNEYESKGTGFSFSNYNAHEMLRTINYARDVFFNRKREWNKIIDRGMAKDFSWNNSAKKYAELYNRL